MNAIMKKLYDVLKEAGIVKEAPAAEPDEMQAVCDKLAAAMAPYGDGAGLAADHPLHALKALHKDVSDKLAARTAKAAADKEAAAKAAEGQEDNVDKAAVADQITKALEPLQKQLVDANKRATDAEAIAKSEREAREVSEERTNLRKFRHVTVDVDKDAVTFAKMRRDDKTTYDFMMSKLEAAENVAKAAKALEQDLGSPLGGGANTAWAEIEQKAGEMVQKGGNGLTIEKAIDKVMQEHPELVKRYKAEQAGSPS